MARPNDCDQENAELRDALAAETRVLRQVRDIAYEGLKPDVDAGETLERLWEVAGESLDPAPELERADELLGQGEPRTQ